VKPTKNLSFKFIPFCSLSSSYCGENNSKRWSDESGYCIHLTCGHCYYATQRGATRTSRLTLTSC